MRELPVTPDGPESDQKNRGSKNVAGRARASSRLVAVWNAVVARRDRAIRHLGECAVGESVGREINGRGANELFGCNRMENVVGVLRTVSLWGYLRRHVVRRDACTLGAACPNVLQTQVQVTVLPRKSSVMGTVDLVAKERQRTHARALGRKPQCEEKHREKRARPHREKHTPRVDGRQFVARRKPPVQSARQCTHLLWHSRQPPYLGRPLRQARCCWTSSTPSSWRAFSISVRLSP